MQWARAAGSGWYQSNSLASDDTESQQTLYNVSIYSCFNIPGDLLFAKKSNDSLTVRPHLSWRYLAIQWYCFMSVFAFCWSKILELLYRE